MHRIIFIAVLVSVVVLVPRATNAAPNVLWITAEDLSPHLGCYGDPYARTPHLDKLARDSVRYTQAFATAPVCSPARSCLITGLYATSLGTQRLRSQFPVPAEVRPFPAYLRAAGYYCTNNVKTDYNVRDEDAFKAAAWDESSAAAHWRKRRSGQPFFAVFNYMTTHQSRISVWTDEEFEAEVGSKLSDKERHDPAQANLPPYYPDTPAARRTWARYHDCITRLDHEVGELLRQLEQDGLADETIVFFFSDHGMGLPRGKRLLHDSGMHVPLLIRIPPPWQAWAPTSPGKTTDQLVSFVDFAPTMLRLCGLPIPEIMQGAAFLGMAEEDERQFVYGARDRVDEAFDVARSVRDNRWLYIRNFFPHRSWLQPEGYSDAAPFRRELRRLAAQGELNHERFAYTAPTRPLEELYDTQADPHQLHNLADSTEYAERLAQSRDILQRWMLDTHDAGFLTEPQVSERMGRSTPYEMTRSGRLYPLASLLAAANLVGRPESLPRQLELLHDEDAGVRYWAAVGLHAAGNRAETARPALRQALSDPSAVVRIEAAAALANLGESEQPIPVLVRELQSDRADVALHAARALQYLGPAAKPAYGSMQQVLQKARSREQESDLMMFLRFSLEAALTDLEKSDPGS